MKITALFAGFLLSLNAMSAAEAPFARSDAALQQLVDDTVAQSLREFAPAKFQSNELAITLVDLRDVKQPKVASFRGDVRIYPASVVKLFYLAAAHQWLEEGKLKDAAELRRALHDMIVDSSNDATHYVLDSLTGTTGGPELPDDEMKIWGEKRNAVNRYFAALGYTNINVNQKTWSDGPYGRERMWVGKDYANRNSLTTDATAQLLSQIVLRQCVSAERSEQMLRLLARNPFGKSSDPDDQAHGFTGPALPAGAKLFSKAGWTSNTRHDAAYVELPDGKKFVLVTFTTTHANERGIIPFVAKKVIEGLR
jgi:beta-lactamase class A